MDDLEPVLRSLVDRHFGGPANVPPEWLALLQDLNALCHRLDPRGPSAGEEHIAARLRESEERLRLTLTATNIGLYDLNLQTGEAIVNPEYARMLGHDPAEFHETNAHWRDRLHPEDRPRVYQTFVDYVAGVVPEYRVEFRQRTRAGTWIWILSLGRIVAWDAQGRPLRMLGTHADITSQKTSEAALEKSEERLRQAVSFGRIGIFDHDHPSPVIFWSRELRDMLGIPEDAELSIEGFLQLIDPDDRSRVADAIRRTHDPEGDGRYEADYRVLRHDGKVRWLSARGQTFFSGELPRRQPVRTVGAVIDITERKLTEARLARAKVDLEARVQERTRELAESKQAAEVASEAKSRFLAMMSHEIRTPLHGITGALHLLRKEPLSPTQRRWIEMASDSARTLLHLLNDILDLSKVEAGKLSLHPVPTDLPGVLTRAIEPFAHRALNKGLAWDLHIDPAVPRHVETDPDRLVQILGNLLGNAVKFTDTGAVRLAVLPAPHPHAPPDPAIRHVRFAVTDTGPGLSSAEQQLLFKPFSQVDNSTTRRHGGTGLGLGICKHLVELLGGAIGVHSTPGHGCTFWFVLPFRPLPDPNPNPNPTPEPAPPPASDLPRTAPPPPRVLVAEDNDINQELACAMIRAAGFECDCVASGQEAVTAAAAGHHVLLFMDCRMPGLDGYTATRRIRDHEARHATPSHPPSRLPIIAMTAHALEGDRELCLAAGMDDYLPKPLEPDTVAGMLAKWLGFRPSPPPPPSAPPHPLGPEEPSAMEPP